MARPWTDDELVKASAMRAEGRPFKIIANVLGRSTSDVYYMVDQKSRRDRRSLHSIPDEVLEERARCFRMDQSLTAQLCGDPLPGRSALDRWLDK